MHLSRKIQSTVHRLIVAGTALPLAGGLCAPAAHAHDDPPIAPTTTTASASKPTTPAAQAISATPASPTTIPALASDIYIDVKPLQIVSDPSETNLSKGTTFALRKFLAKSAAEQHIVNPTDSSIANPKTLRLTLEGEVGMVEVGDTGHHPCTLTLRLYLEGKEGKEHRLVTQITGTTPSRLELASADTYKTKPLVEVMAPKILYAAMNAALGEMIDTLAPLSDDATGETPPGMPPVAEMPLKVALQRTDKEPDSSIVQRIDANHVQYTAGGMGDMVVAPKRRYRIRITSADEGTLYLIALDRETMLPALIDSPLPVTPKQPALLPLSPEALFLSPEERDRDTRQLYFALLQKRRETTPAAAPNRSAPLVRVNAASLAADKKIGATIQPDDNQILISAPVPLSDKLDPTVTQLIHLYRAHPEDWTATRIVVTTPSMPVTAPPEVPPTIPPAKPAATLHIAPGAPK